MLEEEFRQLKTDFAPDSALGSRRTDIAEPPQAVVVPLEAVIEREPVTVLLSAKGWIRAMKGHGTAAGDAKYKEGDKPRFAVPCQTTDKLLFFATNGRMYTLGADKLPGGRGFGEPLRLMIDLPNDQDVLAILVHQPGRKLLVAASDGRGFLVAEDELVAQTKNGKQVLNLASGAEAQVVRPVPEGADHLATIGENRKLLVFPLAELPEMSRGRGVTLQKFRDGGLKDAKAFVLEQGLEVQLGPERGPHLRPARLPGQARPGRPHAADRLSQARPLRLGRALPRNAGRWRPAAARGALRWRGRPCRGMMGPARFRGLGLGGSVLVRSQAASLAFAVRLPVVGYHLGQILLAMSGLFAVPLGVALALADWRLAQGLGGALAFAVLGGLALRRLRPVGVIQRNEALVLTALSFIVGGLLIAGAFWRLGLPGWDALFEGGLGHHHHRPVDPGQRRGPTARASSSRGPGCSGTRAWGSWCWPSPSCWTPPRCSAACRPRTPRRRTWPSRRAGARSAACWSMPR